jgi:general secretion pathway protein A
MYINHFGLKEEPFRLTPDPKFLHLAPQHRAVLVGLLGGVLMRRGILTVTGQIGTGKTTLLHAAMYMMSSGLLSKMAVRTAFLPIPIKKADELLEAILEEFEIRCDSNTKPARLAALRRMLLEAQRSGETAVLMVDEAHLFPIEVLEEIRLLSNMDTHQDRLIQIVLCGQPELRKILRHSALSALAQRIADQYELHTLSAADTRAYIGERMSVAGFSGEMPFSPEALFQIHRYSRGVPRLINQLCEKCLAIASGTASSEVSPAIVERIALSRSFSEKQWHRASDSSSTDVSISGRAASGNETEQNHVGSRE